MKNVAKIAFFCVGGIILTGCVEEDIYYNDPAPSGYTSSYQTDITSGYNQDYVHHSHSRSGSYSSSAGSGYQTYSSGAYSSSAPSSTSTYTASGYSSSRSPATYPSSGYSSSQSPANTNSNSGGYSSAGSNAPVHYAHPMVSGRGHGLFGKAVGNLPRKMGSEQQEEDIPASPGNSSGGWSSSAGQ